MTETSQDFHLSVDGLPGLIIASDTDVAVESTQARWVAVRVQLPFEAAQPGTYPIHFLITAKASAEAVSEKSVFIVPHLQKLRYGKQLLLQFQFLILYSPMKRV